LTNIHTLLVTISNMTTTLQYSFPSSHPILWHGIKYSMDPYATLLKTSGYVC